MRVRIEGFWLAGDPSLPEREHSQAARTIPGEETAIQRVEGLRWTTIQQYDRGNAACSLDFQTARRFASQELLWQFVAEYRSKHPKVGTVYLRHDTSETAYEEYALVNCSIRQQFTPLGVTLMINYHLEFAKYGPRVVASTGGEHEIGDEGGGNIGDEAGNIIADEGEGL